MKKLVVLTMVVALFISIPVCVFAQEGPRGASACKKYAEVFPTQFSTHFKNLGECVSYTQALSRPRDDPALSICRLMRIDNLEEYENSFGTQALGPCIKFYRADSSD